MKILLVRPPRIKQAIALGEFMYSEPIGLDVWASFMVHPDWSLEDFKRFRKYLRLLDPQISSLSPLTPFPNLPLYKEYQERLMAEKEDYEAWSFGQVTIMPSQMSLRRYYYEILKTNLYVNLIQNSVIYMIKKFGFTRVFRLLMGSMSLLRKYIKLMMNV